MLNHDADSCPSSGARSPVGGGAREVFRSHGPILPRRGFPPTWRSLCPATAWQPCSGGDREWQPWQRRTPASSRRRRRSRRGIAPLPGRSLHRDSREAGAQAMLARKAAPPNRPQRPLRCLAVRPAVAAAVATLGTGWRQPGPPRPHRGCAWRPLGVRSGELTTSTR